MGQQLFYSSSAVQTTLAASLTSAGTSVELTSISGYPTQYPFTLLLQWGTSNQEVVTVTQAATGSGPYTFANCVRGEDGTTGVSHSSGAQVNHGVSARDFSQIVPGINLAAFGGDPTGTDFSDTALAAAQSELGSDAGIIVLSPGTWKFNDAYTFGPNQGLVCPAGSNGACLIYYYGDLAFIHAYDPAFDITNVSPLVSIGGTFTGFTIDGTNAGSAAKAFEIGDR